MLEQNFLSAQETYHINSNQGNSKHLNERQKEIHEGKKIQSFEAKLINNRHLVSVEMKLANIEDQIKLNEENRILVPGKRKNKKLAFYVENRDTLYIPELPKVRKPIDISNNIIAPESIIHTSNIGIQSDKINWINQEKEFLTQKIGRDCGTQIKDGELFNFDIDVEPILTVIVSKILEQSMLELNQERELSLISEAKLEYIRKNHEEKVRIKKIELEEINRKKENDNLKKIKKIDKLNKISVQQKLIARLWSKKYLTSIGKVVFEDLKSKNLFSYHQTEIIKEEAIRQAYTTSENVNRYHNTLELIIDDLWNAKENHDLSEHRSVISQRNKYLQKKKEEDEIRLKLEEEEKERKRLAKIERKRLKRIRLLKENIAKFIIEAAVHKNTEHFQEEITNLDGNEEGLMCKFIFTFSKCTRRIIRSIFVVLENSQR